MPEHRTDGGPLTGTTPDPATAAEAVQLALGAYESLCGLAESIEDEWTYVTALAEVGRGRIRNAALTASPSSGGSTGPRPVDALPPDRARAVRLASAEIRAITDPHRAIDWLSTFPAVVELALAPGTRE